MVSPAQARKLLAAVRGLSDRGAHLEAFYACLYYAALRPSEAVMLRELDLYLPKKGWGRIVLAASASRAGTAWTDHGTSRKTALTEAQYRSPLGRRPYDLRHAAVSLWLNSGVPRHGIRPPRRARRRRPGSSRHGRLLWAGYSAAASATRFPLRMPSGRSPMPRLSTSGGRPPGSGHRGGPR